MVADFTPPSARCDRAMMGVTAAVAAVIGKSTIRLPATNRDSLRTIVLRHLTAEGRMLPSLVHCSFGRGAGNEQTAMRFQHEGGSAAMSETDADERTLDQIIGNEISGDDVRAAAHRAFTFLSACVDGDIPDADVGDRIMAARSLLEHAARLPDLLGELASVAELASEDDVAVVLSVLD